MQVYFYQNSYQIYFQNYKNSVIDNRGLRCAVIQKMYFPKTNNIIRKAFSHITDY